MTSHLDGVSWSVKVDLKQNSRPASWRSVRASAKDVIRPMSSCHGPPTPAPLCANSADRDPEHDHTQTNAANVMPQ